MNINKLNIVGAFILLVVCAFMVMRGFDLTDKVQPQAILKKLQVVPAHTNMPPGFKLLVSVDGIYKSAFDSGVCVGKGTKREAVDAAWSQYEFGKRDAEANWKEIK